MNQKYTRYHIIQNTTATLMERRNNFFLEQAALYTILLLNNLRRQIQGTYTDEEELNDHRQAYKVHIVQWKHFQEKSTNQFLEPRLKILQETVNKHQWDKSAIITIAEGHWFNFACLYFTKGENLLIGDKWNLMKTSANSPTRSPFKCWNY